MTTSERFRRPARAVSASQVPAPVLALAAIVSVQFGSALAKPMFATIGTLGTVWLRLLWAAAALMLIARPRLRGRTPGDLVAALALGVASAGMTICFFEAIARLPLGTVATVAFLGPLGVALAASRRRLDLVWTGCAAGGVTLLSGIAGGTPDLAGLGFALAGALCWAAYILLTKRIGARFTGVEGLALSLAVAAIVVTPFGIGPAAGGLSLSTLAATALLAVLVPLLPYVLELRALRRLSTRVFSVLMSCEPAVGAMAGLVVLGELLSIRQLAGVGLVVAASLGASLTQRPAGRA